MFGKVSKQQNIYLKNHVNFFLFLILFSVIYGMIPASMLSEKNETLNYIVNQYTLSFVYFPISIIASSVITFFRINDVYVVKNKNIILYEVLYQITITQLVLWLFWVSGSGILILIHQISVTEADIIHLITVFIYVLFDQFFFSILYLNIWFILRNKGISLMILFIVNLILFSFSVSKVPILIYDFATEISIIKLLSKVVILSAILLFEGIILARIVSKKEF